MSDEQQQVPAIPSRAAAAAAPSETPPRRDAVAFAANIRAKRKEAAAIKAKRAAALKAKKRKAAKRPAPKKTRARKIAAGIRTYKGIARRVKRALTGQKRVVGKHPALALPYGKQPKNPNRPLEMKHQLSALVGAIGGMAKNAIPVLGKIVEQMLDLSRTERKEVIGALQKIYG